MLLYEVVSGEIPYANKDSASVIAFVSSGQRLQRPVGCDPVLYEIMLQCWDADPDMRPTFKELYAIFMSLLNAISPQQNSPLLSHIINGSSNEGGNSAEFNNGANDSEYSPLPAEDRQPPKHNSNNTSKIIIDSNSDYATMTADDSEQEKPQDCPTDDNDHLEYNN